MSGQDYLGTNVEEERLVTPSKVNTEGKPATKFLEPELEQLIFQRGMGVVLPIFSLPSPYGIGTFGDEAYRFCDFLEESGVRYWQLLPMGPTSYGDSPYSSFSSFAGNPYFIDLDFLCKAGLLQREEIAPINFGSNPGYVDYALQYNSRFRLLFRAFSNRTEEMKEQMQLFYEEEKDWLHDYALFMAIKKEQMDVAWLEWPEPYRFRDPKALQAFEEEHGEAIEFQIFIQYLFFEQWKALKEYAHSKNIQFIGDLPIYVALDSVDVWANPEAFLLDEERRPLKVAGAPPDHFSMDGQLWGNPIYNWEKLAEKDYAYWVERIEKNLQLYDILRLDHFIGFSNYWSVDAEEETARHGEWVKGPGLPLFKTLQEKLGPLPFIVEDLGVISQAVLDLRDQTAFHGMKPLQFAFYETDSDYQPHRFGFRTSVYTSTHDSDTLRGWWDELDLVTKEYVSAYFGLNEKEGHLWGILRGACSSVASVCIFQMQDILGLGNEARMNLPGIVGGNWQWRLNEGYFDRKLTKKLRQMAVIFGRI